MQLDIPYQERVLGQFLTDAARRHGNKPFLTVDGRTWTFSEAYEESQAVARGLRKLGVKRHDPVMVMLDNSAEFVFSWFALGLLGAVCVPINTAYTGDMLAYVTCDVKARIVITSAALVRAFADLAPAQRGELSTFIVCGDDGPIAGLETLGWQGLRIAEGETVLDPTQPHDPAFICYTSGTTGPSKGVILPHAVAFQTAQSFIAAVGMKPDDVVFSPLPLFHGMSRTMATLPALVLGAQVHLAPRFSATTFWQDVRRARATISTTIFTIPPILKHKPSSPDDRAHQVRVMFNAHHDEAFEARFGVRLVEAHAMTETGMTVFTPFPERKFGATGKPGPDWEVQLVDANDRPVPTGETGELVLRPRTAGIIMHGYLNKPDATACAFGNLWFHTGDMMRADAQGYLYFAGRKKERIRRRGENISAYEVETIATQHPELVECAVLGVPAGDHEDDVYLVGVLKERTDLNAEALFDWLSARLPRFMVPRYIEFRASLPKTGSAKIERHTLLATVPATGAWDSVKARANTR
ncbi:crotonobetaine/carnitine-CoA ligase [Paraburkholderia unamae]|uniref:AMP-binding protein n=1 Tax=Paraburkholderia unamae TaxID=219649 RepID=UPI000DC3D853|nr:AMP-binding protein [Paraburkholderia unamae]RAR56414.1 crotonobetaine/carnitine-CoA ligase [Paraburkholderia unamae]